MGRIRLNFAVLARQGRQVPRGRLFAIIYLQSQPVLSFQSKIHRRFEQKITCSKITWSTLIPIPLSFVFSWGHNPSKWPTPIHVERGVQKAKSVTGDASCKKFRAAPCSSVTPWRLMDQNHISGVLEHNAQFLPRYPHISMPSAHCKCPTAVTNQREKHGQKAGLKGEIWHLYFWHEGGEWIRLIS